MRKVPPILKPIALLTISTIIATATGVVNSSSYRQSNGTSHSTEITETTETSDVSHSQSVDSQPVSESTEPSTSAEDHGGTTSSTTNNQRTVPSSSIEALHHQLQMSLLQRTGKARKRRRQVRIRMRLTKKQSSMRIKKMSR